MPQLKAGTKKTDADLIVFDKDGTLIDFHAFWGPRMARSAEALCLALDDEGPLLEMLYLASGYDHQKGRTKSQSPLATAPLRDLETVMAAVLFQWGLPWDQAWACVSEYFSPVMRAAPEPEEIRPRGRVQQALEHLREAGFRLAVATTDNRDLTEFALDTIGEATLFELVLCGDDPGVPTKPDPRVLELLGGKLDIPVGRMVMVGDTVSDMEMANRAGTALAVGLTGGADTQEALNQAADVLVQSIEELLPQASS